MFSLRLRHLPCQRTLLGRKLDLSDVSACWRSELVGDTPGWYLVLAGKPVIVVITCVPALLGSD